MGKNAAASNLAANEFCRTRGRVTAKLSVTRRRGVRRGVCRPQHKFFTIFQQKHTLIAGQPHRVLAPSSIESVVPSPCLAQHSHIHMHLLALTFIHFISYNSILQFAMRSFLINFWHTETRKGNRIRLRNRNRNQRQLYSSTTLNTLHISEGLPNPLPYPPEARRPWKFSTCLCGWQNTSGGQTRWTQRNNESWKLGVIALKSCKQGAVPKTFSNYLLQEN